MFLIIGIFTTIYGLGTGNGSYLIGGALLLIAGILAERS
jgi:hypothetical protein